MRSRPYGAAVDLLCAFLRERGVPTAPAAITGEHLTEWINDLLAK